ncbi:hypothetical protein [Actinotalea sp. C106]|uniref:hypothetical protein n=1 Tax=Actinotalea sp. C106 TaxID=2908644 RepID=UPI002029653B|nr:hypothetical protein [Actinotalea sp. C106]
MLAEPGERFTWLLGPSDALAAVQPELHGATTSPTTASAEVRSALADALRTRGVLADPSEEPPRPPRIGIWGEGPVAALLRHLVRPWAQVLTDSVGEGMVSPIERHPTPSHAARLASPPDRAPTEPEVEELARRGGDILVTCAEWLPDTSFAALDAQCSDAGLAWHHCHAEGTGIAVGPMQVPGGPRYRDWRGRRLAASTTPDELESYWAYLSSPATAPPPAPQPSDAVAAVAAGHLLADLQHWWGRRTPTVPAHEHLVDHDAHGRLQVTHHPVLPLP